VDHLRRLTVRPDAQQVAVAPIEAKGKEVAVAIAELRGLTAKARAEDAAQRPDEQAASAAEGIRAP
jgi:hypothetical protein